MLKYVIFVTELMGHLFYAASAGWMSALLGALREAFDDGEIEPDHWRLPVGEPD